MGHKDTRMLERVYGRQTPEELALQMVRAMGLSVTAGAGLTRGVCSTVVTAPMESADRVDSVDVDDTDAARVHTPEKSLARQALQPGGPMCTRDDLVPGGGIEPPTRGFSVPARGWRTPRISGRKPPRRRRIAAPVQLRAVASGRPRVTTVRLRR